MDNFHLTTSKFATVEQDKDIAAYNMRKLLKITDKVQAAAAHLKSSSNLSPLTSPKNLKSIQIACSTPQLFKSG
jgi:hypothetical protein